MILKKSLASIASLLLFALIGEFVLAVFLPQETFRRLRTDHPAMYRESSWLPWELVPGFQGRHRERDFDVAIRINSRGYRGPEFTEDTEAFRILVIGDSYTFGHGVEELEAYTAVLRDELASRRPGRVQVVNAGYAGARHPDGFYLYLKDRGLEEFHPEVVLVALYVGNDIDGPAARHREWPEVDASGLPLRVRITDSHVEERHWVSDAVPLRFRIPVLRDSHLAQLAFTAAANVRRLGGSRTSAETTTIYEPTPTPENAEMFARTERLYAAMYELAGDRGSAFAVLLIPTREQVHPDAFPMPAALDLDRPQRELTAFFREHGIPYLDLRPALQGVDHLLYFRHDPHWTAEGHALAGSAIASYLATQLDTSRIGGRAPAS